MKRLVLLTAALLLAPLGVHAQVEVGIDAGLLIDIPSQGDNVTRFNVPTGSARIGFPADALSFETLLSFAVVSAGDTYTMLSVFPGLNFPIGDSGMYVRGEGALLYLSGDGDSESEFGAGGAVGVKKAIDNSPVSFRFEVGLDRFFDSEVNQVRALIGLSAAVGG